MNHARTTPSLAEDLHLAVLLGVLSAIAVALLFPYLLATMPQVLAKVKLPLPALVLVQSLQALVLLGLLAFGGLRMGHAVGLGSPWLRGLRFGRPRQPQAWLHAIALGVAASLLMLGLSPLFDASMPTAIHPLPATSANSLSWAGLLASFYGAIGEEVQLRLFLMTLIVWTFAKLTKRASSPAVFWFAIVIAALLFGIGHLPAARQVWPLDEVVIARTLVLNGLGGLAFGWLYWKQGFESAMLGHFAADLVLHVAAPLVMGGKPMSTQEFEFAPPGKFAQVFPLFLGLVIPMILVAALAVTHQPTSEWLGALPAFLVLPVAAVFLAWRMHRRTLRLEDGILKAGRVRWLQTAVAALDLDAARIINLGEQRELQPRRRIAGTAMPGYRSGFFRLRDRRRAYVVVTDPRRVLVLPKRDGGLLMFSLVRPEALLDALRRAVDDKAGSAR